MSIKKDKYEISLWEDYIVSAQGEGENLIPEHYEERKIAIIGSDAMTAQWRAVEPKLVNNVVSSLFTICHSSFLLLLFLNHSS